MRLSTYRRKLLKQTREFAENKAKELSGKKALRKKNKKSRGKRKLSRQLYDELNISYGFDECISSGNYGPFPHEMEKKAECFNFAVYQYFIAEALGLKPRLFNVYGLKPDNPKNKIGLKNRYGSFDHSFVDVDVGAKRRVMIDTQMRMHGFVDYDYVSRKISVKDNADTNDTRKRFRRIQEMSVDDIVDKLMFLKSAKGAGEMLSTGQRTGKTYAFGGRGCSIFYKYDKDKDSLEAHISAANLHSANRDLIKRYYLDELGDVERETVQFGSHSEMGWCEYKEHVVLGEFEVPVLERFYDALDNLVEGKFSDVRHRRRMNNERLAEYLQSIGVDGFDIDSSSLPRSVKGRREIRSAFNEMEKVVEAEFEKAMKQPRKDIFKRALAIRELYSDALERRITNGTDHDGYMYCQNSRDASFWEKEKETYDLFDEWKKVDREKLKRWFGCEISPQPDIESHRCVMEIMRKLDDLNERIVIRRKRRKNHDFYNDLLLYTKRRLKGKTPEKLVRMVEGKGRDIMDSYKKTVFESLLFGYQGNYLLNRREHVPKLLKKMKEYKAYCCLRRIIEEDVTRKRDRQKMLKYIDNPQNAPLLPGFAAMVKRKYNLD